MSCPVALAEQDAPSLLVGDGASPNAGQHLFNAKERGHRIGPGTTKFRRIVPLLFWKNSYASGTYICENQLISLRMSTDPRD